MEISQTMTNVAEKLKNNNNLFRVKGGSAFSMTGFCLPSEALAEDGAANSYFFFSAKIFTRSKALGNLSSNISSSPGGMSILTVKLVTLFFSISS